MIVIRKIFLKFYNIIPLLLLITAFCFSEERIEIKLPSRIYEFYYQYNFITAFSKSEERKNIIKSKSSIHDKRLTDISKRMDELMKMISNNDPKISRYEYPINFFGLLRINKIISVTNDVVEIEVSNYHINKSENSKFISLYNNNRFDPKDNFIENLKLKLNYNAIHKWRRIGNEWLKIDNDLELIN